MKLVVEATLDIDEKRKTWLSSIAHGVEVEEVEETVSSMAGALCDQITRIEAAIVQPSKPKQPGTAMPRTFQEDDDVEPDPE